MLRNPLIDLVASYMPLQEEEAALILQCFREVTYRKNEVLLQAGTVAHEVFFLEKGVVQQFYVDEKGNERTCHFCFENEFITDLESFAQQTRSASSIRTLEPVQAYVACCKELMALFKQVPLLMEFFHTLVGSIAEKSIRRTQSLLSLSPEQRFLELLESMPQIFQRVPQRYIAQYLGIAPESLSRIRKQLLIQAKS